MRDKFRTNFRIVLPAALICFIIYVLLGQGAQSQIVFSANGEIHWVRVLPYVTYLVRALTRRVHSRRGAECCISALVALTNCCTANNTVAILSVGSITKDISERFGVDKRRAASLLDIFSCVTQGIIPYGAQLLMASGLAAISPLDITPYLYYPLLLAVCAIISISKKKYPNK